MFDLSWSHILIVLVVALIVVGPKDLPRLMRTAGQWMAKAREMANQFKTSFDEMSRQAELDDLRKEIDALRNQRPLADLENQSLLLPEDQPDRTQTEPLIDHSAPEKALEPEPVFAPGDKPPAP
ncbi:MAG: twin-arginine translocase subunit TatB [Proteobacteria bacterium]|nr:twin-arginine translocase subunit TatB [Pseudomonadota bacterium]